MKGLGQDVIAEKLARDPRLNDPSGFKECAQACLSEWLQMLLVVERIKAHKAQAASDLNALVTLAEDVYHSPLVIEHTSADIMRYALTMDRHWNPQAAEDRRRLDVLSRLFIALDAGHTQSVYLTNAAKNLPQNISDYDGSLKRYENIICTLIPTLLDERNDGWHNLNAWRLHYPHELIVRAMMFHNDIMDALIALRSWTETPFVQLKQQALLTLLKQGVLPQLAEDEIPGAAHISLIREKMVEAMAIELVYKMNAISAAIGYSAHPSFAPGFPLTAKKESEMISFDRYHEPARQQDVVTIKFSAEALMKYAQSGEITEFYLSLDDAVNKAMNIDRPQHNENVFYAADRLPVPIRGALHKTLRWACDDRFLLPAPAHTRVNTTVLLTGIAFSHWLWQQRRSGKMTTSRGASEYIQRQRDLVTKNSTVKQYYERMRAWCQNEIVNIVKDQVSRRAENHVQIKLNLIWPLNIDFYRRYDEFITHLKILTNGKISHKHDINEIISLAKALRILLNTLKDSRHLKLKEFICGKLNIAMIDRETFSFSDHAYYFNMLEKLVALDIDIGWEES